MTVRRRMTLVPGCALAAVAVALALLASLGQAKGQVAAARTAARAPEPIVGLISGSSTWGDATLGHHLSTVLTRTHAKWLREGFYWSWIEPQPGVFDFSHYDHFVLSAAKRHVHVLALMYQAPSWASSSSTTIPADPSAYAGFVAAVVRRYGPGGTFWAAHPNLAGYAVQTYDLWQEPYYDNGDGGQYDPGRYANLVKAAASAGRAVNPAAKFLIAAEMQSAQSGGKWRWWVDAMYQAVPDLNNYFDGISVHPYGHDIKHFSRAIPGKAYNGYNQMRRLQVIRQQFLAHGANKPVWATEVGWPTCTHGSPRCVNAQGQVRSLKALMRYARTTWSSYVKAVFVYYYNDLPGSPSNPENDYGLVYTNHRAKPVLRVFRGYASKGPAISGW